ncbi:LOB domain-containing protein 24-like [Prunus avium]|uniref:LOB domain-containing protein 24-like n=1 Tax=Prunus avium TaxID=42229 RepID=A0A6P5SV59_PRUAV|nr:LOB domain-containing protein 24-like [Prunus avium]
MNMSGRCAGCKYLRRRCPSDCILSPYFPSSDPQRFASVHRIYGASNVAKMLQELMPHLRAQAAETLRYEAQCRIQDPISGCVGVISQLHQQIQDTECQLAKTRAEVALMNSDGQEPPQAQADQQI